MRVLVLLLLLSPVAAQEFQDTPADPDAVHAPIQLLLDQFPTVMRLAIDEATVDGTPHDAEELVARMQAYFQGFEAQPEWPADSEAAASDARSAYARVGALLDVAQGIPAHVGSLSRIDAACLSSATASSAQVSDWWFTAFADVEELESLRGQIAALAADLPPPLDATPVTDAGGRLDAWLWVQAGDVQFCLEEIIIAQNYTLPGISVGQGLFGRSVDPYLRLSLSPAEAYPGAQVIVSGRVVGPVGEVRLEAAGLSWAPRLLPDARGFFSTPLRIPQDQALGSYGIEGRAGDLSANATLRIDRAPVTLHATSPGTLLPGESFRIPVTVHSPLPFSSTPALTINGEPWSRSWTGTAEVAGAMTFVLAYTGDARHAPAETVVHVSVAAPVVFEEPGEGGWELLEKGVWFDPVRSLGERAFDLERPGIAAGALLAIAAAVTTFILLDLGIATRRRDDADFEEEMVEDAGVRWPSTFVHAYALVAQWLVQRRALPAGATPRDVSRYLHQQGLKPGRAVREFEFARYGRRLMPIEMSRKRSHWAQALWKRLGGTR